MNRLAIFDCDGTLVDSGAAIYEALSRTFAQFGLAVPCQQTGRRVIGLSLIEAMAGLVPDADDSDHVALAEAYKVHFAGMRSAGHVAEPLYPGIVELLDRLEGDGWVLGVATGKSDRGLRHCLDVHGLHGRFISLQTGDRHPSKPHPSMIETAMADADARPDTTVMIGDTSFDMAMAVNAGALPIGVAWGYHEREDLIAAGAVGVADEAAQVFALARERAID